MINRLRYFVLIFICIITCLSCRATYGIGEKNITRAHFVSQITKGYGNGDCILLENFDENGNQLFGLIDSGRKIEIKDSNGKVTTPVIEFLKSHGVKKLDFIMLSHNHGDHYGDMPHLIELYKPDRFYLKEYDASYLDEGDNQKSYESILTKCIENNVKVIGVSYESLFSKKLSPSMSDTFKSFVSNAKRSNFSSFDTNNTTFRFGSSVIKIFNWELFDSNGKQIYSNDEETQGTREIVLNENNNSIAALLIQGNTKALFTGDMNNNDKNEEKNRVGDEDRIKNQVGDVDFLKAGHHGVNGSNSLDFLNVIKPENVVITSDIGAGYKTLHEYIATNNVNCFYSTIDDKGISVTFTENEVYFGYETDNEFYRDENGALFFIPSSKNHENYKKVRCTIKYDTKEISVSNFKELKKAIDNNANNNFEVDNSKKTCTIKKLRINLIPGGDYTVTDSIIIKKNQCIELYADEEVELKRDKELINDSMFQVFGYLIIGNKDRPSLITFNGNKDNVKATKAIFSVDNGQLDLYDGTKICNNYNLCSKISFAGTTRYYCAYGSRNRVFERYYKYVRR